jgi:alpha-beta hydrolase superfamily lysophospholipase
MRVLVLHGMFCTAWHTGRLVEGLRGAGLDARGLELPGRGSGRVGLGEHIAYVRAAAAAAGAASDDGEAQADVALVGHSMGGLIALLAAAALADQPWLVKLALLAAAPTAAVSAAKAANLPVFLPGVLGGGSYLPPRARYAALFMNRQDEALRRRVYERLVPEPRALIRSIALPILDARGASRLRLAAAPRFASLVLAAAGDRSTPPALQQRSAALLPGAHYLCLEQPDHYGFIEGTGSAETLACLLAFLRD